MRGVALAGVAALLLGPLAGSAAGAAVLTVDTFEDSFDGSCGDGDCSLRDAVSSVDALGTIRVPSGFYPLSRPGTGGIEDGDLDVERRITIEAVGETGVFVDASTLGDRAFDLSAGATIEGVTILGGSAVDPGGLVRITGGTTRMTEVTLVGGTATDGGILAVGAGAGAVIVRSWVSAGSASGRGGGLFVGGTATLIRSTVSDGDADAGGGAWVARQGVLRLIDTTFSSNAASGGGGGLHVRGEASIRSATIARNDARLGGGILATPGASVSLRSSVLDGNEATERGPSCSRRLTSEGFNLADGPGCGLDGPGDRPGVDPRLGPLRQNGGPTPTHALRVGSPAVGRGGGGCSAVDQRGAPRSDCDTGAYELVFCLGRPATIVGTPGPDDLSGGLSADVFLGRDGDDVFQGSLANDRACGGRGDDRLIGGPDDDRLAGNGGGDVLRGEGGADLLLGGDGRDVCRGGDGADVARRCEVTSSARALSERDVAWPSASRPAGPSP